MNPWSTSLIDSAQFLLPSLPLWQGVRKWPGEAVRLPFALGLDPAGFVRQTTDPSVIGKVVAAYASDDYAFITPPPGTSAWGTRLGEAKLAKLESLLGSVAGKRILEIGGATLYLAKVIAGRYPVRRYVCIDPSLRAEDATAEVIRSYFPSPDLDGESFDVIIANNCIEHAVDALAFAGGIRAALAEDGVAYCCFPDVARCFRDGDLNAFLHEHINYFDETAARRVFTASGLQVVHWHSANDLATCLLKRGHLTDDQLSRTGAPELLLQAIEGLFACLVPKADAIMDRLASGKRIAFYGATNGLNSFLSLAGANRVGTFNIVDGDVAKRGSYLPAHGAPIYWTDEVDFRTYDEIVVTAASFHAEICRLLTVKLDVPEAKITGLFRSMEQT